MYAPVSKSTVLGSLLLLSTVATAATNRPPTISGTPATSVQVQRTYRFFASAADPEGAKITFSIANKPSWAWFDATNGTLGGEPQAAGTYSNIVISASDGKSKVSLPPFTITAMKQSNRAPSIAGTPATSVQVQKAYRFAATVNDADGDKLTFSIANKPSWATFDTKAGVLSGVPKSAGVFSGIIVSASDGKTTASLPAFNIVVSAAANRAPTISGVPQTSVQVKKTYRFFARASDADGNAITFSIANKPVWAWFDARTGTLGGEPQTAGTYSNIVISASDGKASASLPPFSITAVGSNQAVRLSGTPAGMVVAGGEYVFQPVATDPDGGTLAFSISNKPSWASFNTVTGRLSGVPQARDVATFAGIVVSGSDGQSTATLPAFSIAVTQQRPTATTNAATLSWTPPTENIDGTVLVNLSGYRIYHGSSAAALDQMIEIANPGIASYMVENLSAGEHYFAIKSYSSSGVESALSPLVSKVIE